MFTPRPQMRRHTPVRGSIACRPSFAGLLALALCAAPGPASAQLIPIPIPVFDVSRFEEMFRLLITVRSLTAQVQGTLRHVQNAAQQLGGGNLVEDILLGHRRLTADLNAMDYSVDTITAQYRRVFPDAESAKHVSPKDAETLRTQWDREIHQSALAASRAQSALSTVERNTASAQSILERSKASAGATDEGSRLAKLQALVQMLGVLNSDLTTLATTIAATERVNAQVAAATSSDDELDAAKAERMLTDYDKREAIPPVDPRVLGGAP